MNYNQGPPAQTPQQYVRQRKMPMLPPQFQNLLPQELQNLKNQPQFQNAMRQYYQRQQMQMAQMQQQIRPGVGAPNAQVGLQIPQAHNVPGNVASNIPNNPNMPLALPPGVMGAPPQMQVQNAPAPGPNAPQNQMYARSLQQAYLQQKMQPRNNVVAPKPTDAKEATKVVVVPPPSPDPGVEAAAARMAATESPKIPPKFAADSVARIGKRRLRAPTQWSDKLREEGEEVPLSLQVYEETITRDERFLRQSTAQSTRQKQKVERMGRDIKTYNDIKQLRMNAIGQSTKNQDNNSIWGEGYQGYGNGVSNSATLVVMPHQNKSFTKVPPAPYTEAQTNEAVVARLQAGRAQHLVPVRLDFDQERDRFKLRDTFLWDADDETYPLETFVRTLVEDYKFILELHVHSVLAVVNEQIKDYRRKPSKTMGEIRVPIKIDLVINNTQFTDQFEWDILNAGDSDPEEFATILCDEMAFPGEFATAIAFSIREQTQLYHKALFLVGYSFDGLIIREDEIRSHLLPALRVLDPNNTHAGAEDFVSTLRNPGLVADFSPAVSKLTQLEVEKIDKEMERELRRRRRHFNNENFTYNENAPQFGLGRGTSRRSALHSGRGVKTTLPDLSDIPKNFRTPMPSSVLPGGIDLGVPDIFGYNELIINRTQIKNPDYKPPAPPGMVTSFRDSTGSFYVKIRFSRPHQPTYMH